MSPATIRKVPWPRSTRFMCAVMSQATLANNRTRRRQDSLRSFIDASCFLVSLLSAPSDSVAEQQAERGCRCLGERQGWAQPLHELISTCGEVSVSLMYPEIPDRRETTCCAACAFLVQGRSACGLVHRLVTGCPDYGSAVLSAFCKSSAGESTSVQVRVGGRGGRGGHCSSREQS